jgi:hypothetical protein
MSNIIILITTCTQVVGITLDVDSTAWSLRYVNVGNVADVSELYTTSIFTAEMSRLGHNICFRPTNPLGERKSKGGEKL